MKNFFNNIWKDNLASALATVVIGIIVTALYKYALDTVCVIAGVGLLGWAVVMVIKYFTSSVLINRYNLLLALVLGGIGGYLVLNPSAFLGIITVIFGIYILFNGIIDLQSALIMKKANVVSWQVALIISIIAIIFGIVLIVLKKEATDIVSLVTGIMLIIQGAMDIWVAVKVNKIND